MVEKKEFCTRCNGTGNVFICKMYQRCIRCGGLGYKIKKEAGK